MHLLGIETSCDETGVALVEGTDLLPGNLKILSNIVASSAAVHKQYGGIVPEQAARKQLEYILPVLEEALKQSYQCFHGNSPSLTRVKQWAKANTDAIAVTAGPGLVGSLLVGVETAKTLAYLWEKPLIPVNHLLGHIYSAWLLKPPPHLPAIALIVSGGHTLLVQLKKHGHWQVLGATRDDAAGEAFDKIARVLGFTYPGGPALARAAEQGNPARFPFPRPMLNSDNYEFSFSGLKTAVLRRVYPQKFNKQQKGLNLNNKQVIADLAASVQAAIVDVLVAKTLQAVQEFRPKSLIIGGGVAANARLREKFRAQGAKLNVNVHIPPLSLCTDNAAVIAAAAFYNYKPLPWQKVTADPALIL